MLLREARKAEQTGFPGQSTAFPMKRSFYQSNRTRLESLQRAGGRPAEISTWGTPSSCSPISACTDPTSVLVITL